MSTRPGLALNDPLQYIFSCDSAIRPRRLTCYLWTEEGEHLRVFLPTEFSMTDYRQFWRPIYTVNVKPKRKL